MFIVLVGIIIFQLFLTWDFWKNRRSNPIPNWQAIFITIVIIPLTLVSIIEWVAKKLEDWLSEVQ